MDGIVAEEKDILKDGLEAFAAAEEAESENRKTWLDDVRFSRLAEQWPEQIRSKREAESRPCLTVNRMPSFGRQVVNEIRQNKIGIKVSPVDGRADPVTAHILGGLIRNIETVSKASHAYEAASEDAVYGGWGYWRIDYDYAHDDTFDQEITIDRIVNPLCVYGDPLSKRADSADWNDSFVTDMLLRSEFEKQHPGHELLDFNSKDGAAEKWCTKDSVLVAEWFHREEVQREILLLSNGMVIGADAWEESQGVWAGQGVVVRDSRTVPSHKVTHRLMSGAGIIETTDWPGRYIPIIPVYGDEKRVDGKRYFHSLIHDAIDAQRMHNYWRTVAAELGALAPKAPWLMPEDAFPEDEAEQAKWDNANTENYGYLLYRGANKPERQAFAGVPAGAMNEAMIAADDMKAIIGLYDASLGQRSNETSGKAINARQREGDTATYHFIDNVARAISHTGTVLVDLIPSVYTGQRIIRIIGNDGSVQNVKIGPRDTTPGADAQTQQGPQEVEPGMKLDGIYDLSTGRYDVTVEVGPSYATQRQEAAEQMTEFIRAYPEAAQFVGDLWAKNLDWPGADEIAQRLKMMLPANLNDGIPPELMKMIEEGKQMIAALQAENENLKNSAANDAARNDIDREKNEIDRTRAGTDRIKAQADFITARANAKNAIATAEGTMTGNQAMSEIGALVQAITLTVQQMQQSHAAMGEMLAQATRPKKKVARAQKQPDGSMVLESVES